MSWAATVRERHTLVHDYFGVDLDEVWNAVVHAIPALKPAVARLSRELPPAGE
ncbi:MAG: DUF86 domain-containing protein [Armatimonadetes bacterium]|nr:DUF86 domain-containing protein [Armatimonadota bacterium]